MPDNTCTPAEPQEEQTPSPLHLTKGRPDRDWGESSVIKVPDYKHEELVSILSIYIKKLGMVSCVCYLCASS